VSRALRPRLSHLERLPAPLARAAGILLTLGMRASARRAGVALLYHLLDSHDGDPKRELVPAVAVHRFDAQAAFLTRWYRIVPASELQAAASARRRFQRYPVAITFDDDTPSHLTAGRMLRGHGAPGTFFLTGASLESPSPFWWELLQAAFDRELGLEGVGGPVADAPAGASIHEVAERIILSPPAPRREAERGLEALVGEIPGAGLDREQVAELGEGLAVGFHTPRHDYLPMVPDHELGSAVGDRVDELRSVVSSPVSLFAYPFGGFDERVAEVVRSQGFSCAFTTEAVAVTPATDPMMLGRWEPHAGIAISSFAISVVRLLRRAG
jgi:peptidoglycan/xylan/chitin deacetylase (PgdA/CDA1 family)